MADISLKSLVSQMLALKARLDALTGGGAWQTPGSLGSGWAQGAGSPGGSPAPLRYRIDPGGMLRLDGTIHATSATPAANVCTLPSGYRPASEARFSVGIYYSDPVHAQGSVDSSGVLQVAWAGALASGTEFHFHVAFRLT